MMTRGAVIEMHEHNGEFTEWKNPLGNMSAEAIQSEISLTKIVRCEQNHLPQKFGPAHENTGAAATKRR